MSTKEFYTCSSITTPSKLVHLGATAHPILYSYEINTPIITDTAVADEFGASSAEVSEAIERVQQVILHNMAIHSGLTDCVVIAKQREGGSWRGMRRLLPQDRGSTSIVGVSLEPEDVVDENGECFRPNQNILLCIRFVSFEPSRGCSGVLCFGRDNAYEKRMVDIVRIVPCVFCYCLFLPLGCVYVCGFSTYLSQFNLFVSLSYSMSTQLNVQMTYHQLRIISGITKIKLSEFPVLVQSKMNPAPPHPQVIFSLMTMP